MVFDASRWDCEVYYHSDINNLQEAEIKDRLFPEVGTS
jgi:hypothetical protein